MRKQEIPGIQGERTLSTISGRKFGKCTDSKCLNSEEVPVNHGSGSKAIILRKW